MLDPVILNPTVCIVQVRYDPHCVSMFFFRSEDKTAFPRDVPGVQQFGIPAGYPGFFSEWREKIEHKILMPCNDDLAGERNDGWSDGLFGEPNFLTNITDTG